MIYKYCKFCDKKIEADTPKQISKHMVQKHNDHEQDEMIQEAFRINIAKSFLVMLAVLCFFAYFNNALAMSFPRYYPTFPVDSMPYNQTLAKWNADWWQWLVSIPISKSPANDTTGVNCASDQQNSDVWFLAGSTASGEAITRHCVIPAGKSIIFPITNGMCSYADTPTARNESSLTACAYAKATKLVSSVDGVNVSNYFVSYPLFNITMGQDNILGTKAGLTKGVAMGYYVFLRPLPVGTHVIHWMGIDKYAKPGGFSQDITYYVKVVHH